MKTIESRGLSAGSLYKILFIGLVIPVFLFGFLCGVASYFGYATVTYNDQYIFGLKGLIGGSIIGIVSPIFMAAFLWILIYIGLWVWTRFKTLTLNIKE